MSAVESPPTPKPEIIIYERWWAVDPRDPNNSVGSYASLDEALIEAAQRLRGGANSVTIRQVDRERKS